MKNPNAQWKYYRFILKISKNVKQINLHYILQNDCKKDLGL
jgi:hypothetical protein